MSEPNPYHDIVMLAPRQNNEVLVRIENTYEDDHECAAEFVVPAPPEGAETLTDWWGAHVSDLTGCGHGLPENHGGPRTLDCYSEARIISASPVNGRWLGETWEWGL